MWKFIRMTASDAGAPLKLPLLGWGSFPLAHAFAVMFVSIKIPRSVILSAEVSS
jgi:hypothetical protein